MRNRVLCLCAVLAFAAPLRAQTAAQSDAASAQAIRAADLDVSAALRPATPDARLFVFMNDTRRSESGAPIPWPEDPGLQAVAASVIGCVGTGALFFLLGNANSKNDFLFGCMLGGVVGAGAPSGWKLPDDDPPGW